MSDIIINEWNMICGIPKIDHSTPKISRAMKIMIQGLYHNVVVFRNNIGLA